LNDDAEWIDFGFRNLGVIDQVGGEDAAKPAADGAISSHEPQTKKKQLLSVHPTRENILTIIYETSAKKFRPMCCLLGVILANKLT
jgi:hypothetical protein